MIPSIARRWLVRFLVLLFSFWGLAGFFMDGEDTLTGSVPLIVVLGGGVAGERLQLACQLFKQGHGRLGVVLTGGGQETFVQDRLAFVRRCGVPEVLLRQWPSTADSYQEIRAVGDALLADSSLRAIVVSDALHMPRLRFLRDKFALGGRMILQESRLGGRYDPDYCFHVMMFWFREPLAYVYYRLKY